MDKETSKKKYVLVATFVAELVAENDEAAAKLAGKWRDELPDAQREEIENIKVFSV